MLAAALALAALDARALTLGEPQLRSALGENLDLRIPVTIDKGESIEPSCFSLAREPVQGVPRLTIARLSLERSAIATYLRVRTEELVSDPALAMGIVAACPGQFAEVRREYTILVDPPKSAAAPAPIAPAGETASQAPVQASPPADSTLPSIATLIARIGDTLESIAQAIFPGNRSAKTSYIRALRESNPPLASLGDRDPIPIDTPIALPDLRTFEHSRARASPRAAASPQAPREASAAPSADAGVAEPVAPPAAPRQAPARRAPARRAPERTALAPPAAPEAPPAAPRKPAAVRTQTVAPGFVLKLSSGEMDLSPSRSVDDRMRAQLRDRQLVLDADDQVAAVLSLRNSVRQLESRVAELQLKLAGMPTSFPAPRNPEAQPAAPAPVTPAPRRVEAQPATPAPAASAPPDVEAKPATPAPAASPPAAPIPVPTQTASPPPEPAAAQPQPETTPPVAEKTVPPPPVAPPAAAAPKKTSQPSAEIDWLYYGLWALAFLLVAVAILLAMRLARRRREDSYDYGEESAPEPSDDEIVVALEPPPREFDEFEDDAEAAAMVEAREFAAAAPPAAAAETSSDDLRRRYIEERFPEIGKGAISLEDPASVVKGARLFYEDGAIARAVELLQFAIEHHPGEVRSWLALFEIFRLEALTGEFAELARRFREQHGADPYWRKVQYFGREIDPGNELYAEKPLNTFETIGPAQASRLAAEASFDPVAENWLGAPMDFQNEVLANELRKALMSAAGIGEGDLVPNPMPALRNVEMFTVA